MIRVLVCGAFGKMGREVLKAVHNDNELSLVGVVDLKQNFVNIGEIIGKNNDDIIIGDDLQDVINKCKPNVMVDFTNPHSVMNNMRIAIKNVVHPVVGTTGISSENLIEISDLCKKYNANALISPNFSVGAILMMKLAETAAKYLPHTEIIEYHHDQKLDAPSGTALRTAELICKVREPIKQGHPNEIEKLPHAKGAEYEGIRIHSVRLPGYVAHQEVIFGGLGQTLTIRHDSISRESFMPGVVLACKKVSGLNGLVYGLENIMD